MTISKAIIQALEPYPDGYRVRAGHIYDETNRILIVHGEKMASHCSIKRVLARLHICVSINNTPKHPSDMRIVDRTGNIREVMEL